MTSRSPVISAQDLNLTLGQGDAAVQILRGLNLIVEQGQTVALLGPSGSGKSSLMAVLAGENGGAIFDHGSGGIVLLRAA